MKFLFVYVVVMVMVGNRLLLAHAHHISKGVTARGMFFDFAK